MQPRWGTRAQLNGAANAAEMLDRTRRLRRERLRPERPIGILI